MATKWSDDRFLDALRASVDLTADRCVAQLAANDNERGTFHVLNRNDVTVPADAPAPIRAFFTETDLALLLETDRTRFPKGVDEERLRRGERVFLDHCVEFCLILLGKSLPEGYAAPCLSELLAMSGNLEKKPYRRLIGVLQLVVDVCEVGGFEPEGRAIAAARQARLLHAGVRRLVTRIRPEYVACYGAPANFEDMLGTIMGLSLLIVNGAPQLWGGIDDAEAEDFYYLWRAFAVAMGIHPPGQEGSDEWVPRNIAEAQEFYHAYERRHYEHNPASNPTGCALAGENLRMLKHLLPGWARALGGEKAIELLCERLLGAEACRRVGLPTPAFDSAFAAVASTIMQAGVRVLGVLDRLDPNGRIHPTLSTMLLKDMIRREYGPGTVTFLIPESIGDVRLLVA